MAAISVAASGGGCSLSNPFFPIFLFDCTETTSFTDSLFLLHFEAMGSWELSEMRAGLSLDIVRISNKCVEKVTIGLLKSIRCLWVSLKMI